MKQSCHRHSLGIHTDTSVQITDRQIDTDTDRQTNRDRQKRQTAGETLTNHQGAAMETGRVSEREKERERP